MTTPKLVTTPPDGSGLVPSIVDRHYQDLVRGKPGELLAAQCLLQPVGQKSRRTKDGWKTEVVYELVRLEPARDSHTADNIAWEIGRAYEARTSGTEQEMLSLANSPAEQREKLIEALWEWAGEQNIPRADLDERWTSYFGGSEHAASETVQAGSLLQLMEFGRYVGAVEDPKAGNVAQPGEEDDTDPDEDAGDTDPFTPDAGSTSRPPFQSPPDAA